MSRSDRPVIRASEIGEYAYCARAWWLHRVQGAPTRNVAALRSGQDLHEQHGLDVKRLQFQQRLALWLVILALLIALAAVLLVLGVGS